MKYELDTMIYFFKDSKVHSASVLSRMKVENLFENLALIKEQVEIFAPFGKGGVYYSTCYGIISENEVFSSKEELLKSL